MTMAHDLIDEPLLSWRNGRRRRMTATLPGLLAALANGELADFPRVRAHQFHPWCMFLTQLAAIALRRAGRTDLPISEGEWRSLILELTQGAHEPWCLVVEDLSKPAFFQPPVPEGGILEWRRSEHPDGMDVLVTSKAHDVKADAVAGDDLEAWILALVTLQTMQGYSGGAGGYNGIARMKGGYGSRPRVGYSPDHTPAKRFIRDVTILIQSWDGLVDRRHFDDMGLALVWTAPWDGATPLTVSDLSPYFIEVCRRVRCRDTAHGIECAYTTSETRRCLPEIDNGDAGDPWVPVEREEGALTVGSRGFDYKLLTRLLLGGDYEPAAAQNLRPTDGDPMLLITSVMARGQGKTEGLHERVIPLTGPSRRLLGQPDTRSAAGRRATANVQRAEQMRSKVLFPALQKLALGETSLSDEFDKRVDEVFFDHLFAMLETPEQDAQLAWDRVLHASGWAELQCAVERCCVPSARWYRTVSHAEGTFRGCLRKHFPTLSASLDGGSSKGPSHDE